MNLPDSRHLNGSLYVGDLHPEVTEAILFHKFSAVGPLVSIRVCRDITTRASLGYGYINFRHFSDADKALNTMNLDVLRGKAMRIMWCQRDPAQRRSGVGNVIVQNLDPTIDSKQVYEIFSQYGSIMSYKMGDDNTTGSSGHPRHAFVHFESEQAATSAIQNLNGRLLNGQKLSVEMFTRGQHKNDSKDDSNFTNVYIKNFGPGLKENELRSWCQPYGLIISLKIEMEFGSVVSKGFGYVLFETHDAAQKCVANLNGREYQGKVLYAGPAKTRAERRVELQSNSTPLQREYRESLQKVNLYIKNLDDDIDEERLRREFSTFGSITSVKVERDGTGCSRGFGFVCFRSPGDADKALNDMNRRIISRKPLYVAYAQSKETRQAQFMALQHGQINQFTPRSQVNPPQQFPAFNNYYQPPTQPQPMYRGQLAQIRSPRWPTAQARPAVQSAYPTVAGVARPYVGQAPLRGVQSGFVSVQHAPFMNVQDVESVLVHPVQEMSIKEAVNDAVPTGEGAVGHITSAAGDFVGGNPSRAGGVVERTPISAVQRAAGIHPSAQEEVLRDNAQLYNGRDQNNRPSQDATLHVPNLADDVDDWKLLQLYAPYGQVTGAKVMTSDDGRYGIVYFSSPEEVSSAVARMRKMTDPRRQAEILVTQPTAADVPFPMMYMMPNRGVQQ